MTRFEKDIIEIEEGNEIEVLKRRKAELDDLYKKGRCEKNSFKRQCIAQEYISPRCSPSHSSNNATAAANSDLPFFLGIST